jgi:LAO/AO transport system kinase
LTKIEETAKGILAGDQRSIARAITIVENNDANAAKLVSAIYSNTGHAHVIGITGPGGSGKSTLIEKIVREYRKQHKTVGVVAVDPTSPFTGGAFLGDRIRMQELSTDEGVFIRSMASRNCLGGIAKATKYAIKILDAAGRDIILVETVGAGQSEVEIIKVAQTIVVIHAPGLGDEIQAIKAGLMEIADIFVINKADRENADKAVTDIQAILQMNDKEKPWKTPILKTVALTGEGVPQLVEKLEAHKQFLEKKTERSLLRAEAELTEALKEKAVSTIINELKNKEEFEELLHEIIERRTDPYTAAEQLLKKKFKRR